MTNILINPFTPLAVAASGLFAGRTTELAGAERRLEHLRRGVASNFAVVGERGIGKSSLMARIHELAIASEDRPKFLVVSVDLDQEDDFCSILGKLELELIDQFDAVKQGQAVAKKAVQFAQRFEAFGVRYDRDDAEPMGWRMIDDLAKRIREVVNTLTPVCAGVLILIDEADQPPDEAMFGLILRRLIERLQKLGVNRAGIGIAGQTNLISRLKTAHASSPRHNHIDSLTPLTESECREVVRAGMAAACSENATSVTMEETAEQCIVDWSEGYPHFLQQYAHAAFEHVEGSTITLTSAYSGAYTTGGAIDQLGWAYFNEMFADPSVSDVERAVLATLATGPEKFFSLHEMHNEAAESAEEVDSALKVLVEKGIVRTDAIRTDQWKITSRSFASWIRTHLARNRSRRG